MLTARDSIDDRVQGLDSGADDYLVKPFALRELSARLRALVRRQGERSPELTVADLVINPATHEVRRAGQEVRLNPREYAILEYLARNTRRIVTRVMLLEHVWNYDDQPFSNIVDVYIGRIRRKIDNPYPVKLLETVRGVGYRLHIPAEVA
jgi:DNA-binding response OmpR family regulator